MEAIHVERLDHLGLIASVINDLGLVSLIDARLQPDDQEAITPGEAVKGMMLNGLGFAHRPLSLSPQFFANKPLDLLFRPDIKGEMCNRFKLGRTLDEVNTYGSDLLFSEMALVVCRHEAIDQRFNHLDTTRFSLTGDYVPESDPQASAIPHGYSKDHRPDLQQAVLELMVSQDGGVPLMSKTWDGNASDSQIFQDRAKALLSTFAQSPTPRYLIADSKLYSKDNAAQLKPLGFITRIPDTLTLVSQVIRQALREDTWQALDDTTRYHRLALGHYGMAQRWFVICSEAATQRAEKSVSKAQKHEFEAIDKQLFHLQARRFESQQSAQAALAVLAASWRYHHVASTELSEHKRYVGKGRPSVKTPIKASAWQMQAEVRPDAEAIRQSKQHKGCFVLGTNIEADDLRDEQLSCVSRGPCMLGDRRLLRLPRLQITHHGVHDRQQLMHAGREGHLLRFARGQQALVKGFDHGIVARGHERPHIQHRPDLGATSVHSPPAAQRPTVTVKGGNADQGGEWIGAQGAQLGDVA